jgi:branched-chain amino acid transport system substrate-binding protein
MLRASVKTQRLVRGAAVLGAVVAIAGCGSSSSSKTTTSAAAAVSSATSSTAAGSTGTGTASGAPILIGNVGTYSGPVGSGAAYTPTLVQKWASEVNSAGGINGHKVKIFSQDDAGDPTKSLTAVEQQIQTDHVIGFTAAQVPVTAQAIGPYLLKHRIPVVGGDSAVPTWYSNPMFFAIAADTPIVGEAQAIIAKADNLTKIAIWPCNQGAPCTEGADAVKASAQKLGIKVVNQQTIALSQPNFQSNCLAAKSAGAQGIQVVADPSTYTRVMASCAKVGYFPKWMIYTLQVSSSETTVPNASAIGMQQTFPFFLTSGSPALTEWGQAIKGAPANSIAAQASGTWVSLKLLQQALTTGIPKGGTPTSAELLKGLYSIKNDTLGGLSIPLTFTAGKPSPEGKCWFDIQLSKGKFTAPHGTTPQCA